MEFLFSATASVGSHSFPAKCLRRPIYLKRRVSVLVSDGKQLNERNIGSAMGGRKRQTACYVALSEQLAQQSGRSVCGRLLFMSARSEAFELPPCCLATASLMMPKAAKG